MADYEMIRTERRGDVLVVTLNRPDRLNAAPPQMFDELRAALGDLDGARAVLITGEGRAFCSGADVGGGALGSDDPGNATYTALTEHYNPTMLAITDLGVPVVTAVRGPAAGIGCSLALAGDFCVAAQRVARPGKRLGHHRVAVPQRQQADGVEAIPAHIHVTAQCAVVADKQPVKPFHFLNFVRGCCGEDRHALL